MAFPLKWYFRSRGKGIIHLNSRLCRNNTNKKLTNPPKTTFLYNRIIGLREREREKERERERERERKRGERERNLKFEI